MGPLCKTWSVKQKDGKQKRALPEIIRDLREKVIDASNELKVGLAQNLTITTDGAVQLSLIHI